MRFITLREWNQRQIRPRSIETVLRWVRSGKLYPPPFLDGREYLIQETAIKINPANPKQFASDNNKLILRERIRQHRRA
ncbi:excisionase [Pantoea sp. Al-1710]|uniref:Excisionase n=1 Tax=Candidatus Pantoea communis TaxID=2608354 RepID=A0ABX0RL44_9GAMM|nr:MULTISPECIES: excisionase [Pantoea]NIG12963.1 excisionase [Pantoea sp. Cy-640]NIG17336.1 excisionase [Pantoea communis]